MTALIHIMGFCCGTTCAYAAWALGLPVPAALIIYATSGHGLILALSLLLSPQALERDLSIEPVPGRNFQSERLALVA